MPRTALDVIRARISAGRWKMDPVARKDSLASSRFLDSTSLWIGTESPLDPYGAQDDTYGDSNIPTDVGEGQINYLANNIIVNTFSTCINDPDFDVKCPQATIPDAEAIVRMAFRELWDKQDWAEIDQATYLQMKISGQGYQTWFWNDSGPQFEQVDTWDLAIDPNITKWGWRKPRWFARRIRKPYDEIMALYPDTYRRVLGINGGPAVYDRGSRDYQRTACNVWIYFDKNTECHLYEGGLEGNLPLYVSDNMYGEVPLLTLKGVPNPRSPFSLSDYDLAYGEQALIVKLLDRFRNSALNGGSVLVVDENAMGDEAEDDELHDDVIGSILKVDGRPVNEVLWRLPAEAIDSSLLEVLTILRAGLDETTGVNELNRGVASGRKKTATETALMAQQSSARGVANRVKFERFLNRKVKILLDMIVKFGRVETDNDWVLWQAMKSVESLSVVERSTVFRDPVTEQTSSMQLFELMANSAPMLAQQGSMPNLPEFAKDVLRAFNRQNVEKYFIQIQQPQPQMAGGAGPGGAPPGGGPGPSPESLGAPGSGQPAPGPSPGGVPQQQPMAVGGRNGTA